MDKETSRIYYETEEEAKKNGHRIIPVSFEETFLGLKETERIQPEWERLRAIAEIKDKRRRGK